MNPQPAAVLVADFARCVAAFEAEFDYVYHALRRHGVVDSDVEDLVQEVFLVMWRRWAQFDTSRPIRPWLGGIAFRVAYNHRQRAGREVPRGFVDVEDHSPDPEQSIASDSARTLVRRVLAALPEKHRSLIVSHDVDGVSVREIAETLDVPIPTAHTRLRAARKAFAKALRRQQTVSATRARLAPLLLAEQQAKVPSTPDDRRRRALARSRAVALTPGFPSVPDPLDPRSGRVGADASPAPAAAGPLPPPLWKAWLPVAGATVVAGAGLLIALWLGSPSAGPTVAARPAPVVAPAPVAQPVAPRLVRSKTAMLTSLASVPGAGPRFQSLPPPAPAELTLGQGLVGYWRFDDGYGSVSARDLSGNGNDCSLRRLDPVASWVEGRLGGGIALTGMGWLECPRVEAVARLSREITIALWVKRGNKDHVRALVSRQFGNGGLDTFHFGLRGDALWMRSRVKGGPAHAPFPRSRGQWYHVATTVDASGTARIYVSGDEAIGKFKDGRPGLGGGNNPLIIGGGVNGPDPGFVRELFQGVLDELVIYDRALGAEEIRALAAGSQPRLSP